MKLAVPIFLVALLLPGAGAFAQELKPHHQRMKACNTRADAKGLTAGERNHFIRSCLNGKNGNGHPLTPNQRRNQDCSRQARELRLEGAERRGFMSECEKPPLDQKAGQAEKLDGCHRRAGARRLEGEDERKYINGCTLGMKS